MSDQAQTKPSTGPVRRERKPKQLDRNKLACALEIIEQICGRHEAARQSGKLTVEIRYNRKGEVARVIFNEQNII